MLWVRTVETEDALYIVIRANRERVPTINIEGPPMNLDLKAVEARWSKVKKADK